MATASAIKKLTGDVHKSLNLLTFKVEDLDKHARAAPSTGVIACHFTDFSMDIDEGPVYSMDRAWTRTFQSVSDRTQLIEGGPHSIQLILNYFQYFSKAKEIRTEAGLSWLDLKIRQLNDLVDEKWEHCFY